MTTYQRPRYLTPDQFRAALKEFENLSISRPLIYSMLEQGKIRALRVGAHYRIPVEQLEELPKNLLLESKGVPAVHSDLLGTPKHK